MVIAVDDIHAAMRQVTDAGGEVPGAPMEIPGIGHYVSFTDTERNRVGMLQPFPRSGPAYDDRQALDCRTLKELWRSHIL